MYRHMISRIARHAVRSGAACNPGAMAVRSISLSELGPLKKLMENPELLKAGILLSKDDGRTMHEKMTDMMTKDPALAKTISEAVRDPEMMGTMKKMMEDESIRTGVESVMKKYTDELSKK